MQINQELVRFNRALTEEINKKVLKTLIARQPLFSERKPSIYRVNITLEETGRKNELNRMKSRIKKPFARN